MECGGFGMNHTTLPPTLPPNSDLHDWEEVGDIWWCLKCGCICDDDGIVTVPSIVDLSSLTCED